MGQSRLWAGRPSGPKAGQGPFPGLWPLCAAHPTPAHQGLFAQQAWGGADNSGCSLRRWATGRISPGTWHLAWEPAPPTRSLGKARPTLGEGAGTLHVPLCDGVYGHFLGRYWVPGPAHSAAPHAHPRKTRTPSVGETLTAGEGCGGGGHGHLSLRAGSQAFEPGLGSGLGGGCAGLAGRPPGADDVLMQAALAALTLGPQA